MSTPPQFEWQTAEGDAEWAQLCGERVAPSTALSRRVYWSMAICFVLLAAAGGWRYAAHVRAQPSVTDLRAAVYDDLQKSALAAIPIEDQVWDGASLASYQAQFIDRNLQSASSEAIKLGVYSPGEELDSEQNVELHTLEMQDDLVLVTIKTSTHRWTRFYRRTADGWQATAPDTVRWGPVQRLETASFVFEYQANDGETVAAIAPQVEAMYMAMRGNFGLANPSPHAKIVVEVRLTQGPGDKNRMFAEIGPPQPDSDSPLPRMKYRIWVASPALYRLPVELSDADLLAQSLALPLVTHVVSEVSRNYGSGWQMLEETNMFRALTLWQLWDLVLPLAAWRETVVQWRLHALPSLDASQAPALPPLYHELCAMHHLWLSSPQEIGVPLICSATDPSPSYRLGMYLSLAGQADEFVPPVVRHARTSYWIDWSSDPVALATLLEFIVSEYGRERLPVFLQGVANHTSVDTLLPQVFGISAKAFESNWQAYLAAQYNLHP